MASSSSGSCCGQCTIKDTQFQNANKKYDYLYKFILVGYAGVGKSSLLTRFVDDSFSTFPFSIGVDFKIKTVELDGKKIKLQIWDTAGGERFHTIVTSYYRGTRGALVIYDVTNATSFDCLSHWLDDINNYDDQIQPIVVGNKCDLENERQVSIETAQAFVNGMGIPYVETSAKTNVNVEQLFMMLTSLVNKRFDGDKNIDIHSRIKLSS